MAIQTEATTKTNFPRWTNFCTLQGDSIEPAERFSIAYNSAVTEMNLYIVFTDDTATDQLNMLFERLVKKHCFDFRQGDKEFEHRPAVLRDYDDAIKTLKLYQSGKLPNAETPGSNGNSITMDAKDRKFGTWFTDQFDDLASTE